MSVARSSLKLGSGRRSGSHTALLQPLAVVTISSTFHVSGKQSDAQMKSLKHLIRSAIILPSSEGLGSGCCFLNGSPTLTAGMRIVQTLLRLRAETAAAQRNGEHERRTRKQPEKQRQLQAKQAKSFSLITERETDEERRSGYALFPRRCSVSLCKTSD